MNPSKHSEPFIRQLSLIFLSLLMVSIVSLRPCQAQREADIMYFGYHTGLDFSTGEPVVLYNSQLSGIRSNYGSICDTLSNLLFYNNFRLIINSQQSIMENGDDFEVNGTGNQSNLIVPWPESDSLYFVFKIEHHNGTPWDDLGLYYNIVDMSQNNGLGSVIEKDILLQDGLELTDMLFAVKHKNKRDIWIICRNTFHDNYVVFLVTPEGINETSVVSEADNVLPSVSQTAYIKVSYDKKYLFTSFGHAWERWVEVCKFNSESGEVEFLYKLDIGMEPVGMEFSPDSKYAYISYDLGPDSMRIFQFDMQYIEDRPTFINTRIDIGGNIGRGLQLATDGKIYCFTRQSTDSASNHFVGVIHKPWEYGTACDYQARSINLSPGATNDSHPSILLDYLHRFDFDGVCEGEPFQFTSFFNPEPDSIQWDFNDPGSGFNTFSNDLHPIHDFSDGGVYEVEVDVWYPSGRFEHTSREVVVAYGPEPDLGPDTTICSTTDLVLDAECGPHNYLWSTGNFGSSHITVSDTGWYWVKVTSSSGCYEIDSIHISKYPAATVDSSNLVISPTTCGGNTGAIRGLLIQGIPPYVYVWTDDLGNPVASTLDIYHLPVGNFTLHYTDSTGCTVAVGPYSVIDVGDVLVESVSYSHEHCDQGDGSIWVTATSGLGDMLYYSIDNGANYVQNLGQFSGLSAGAYAVRVQDSSLCEDAYIHNPISIENSPGPQIDQVIVGPATVGQSDGSILIIASSADDTLNYSNDGGLNYQINDGLFTNLQAGFYSCVVLDEHGCDTTFMIEVVEDITIRLQAIAGDDQVCPGLSAYVPLTVDNFNDVASFSATLFFDENTLSCQGFTNSHGEIDDSLEVFLFPAEGKVELQWSSDPLSLSGNSHLIDLVFETNGAGGSLIEWGGSPGNSWFLNSTGLSIPVDYSVGEVKLYEDLQFSLHPKYEVCEGDSVTMRVVMWSSNGPENYWWTLPDGSNQTASQLTIGSAQKGDEGEYLLRISDTANCFMEKLTQLTVHDLPYPDFAVQDTIYTQDPIQLDAGPDFVSYLWNTGDTTRFTWADNEAWYLARVESYEGCVGEDSSFVIFSTPAETIHMYFPNAFTPNGDGLNDEFRVVTDAQSLAVFSLSIFNSWGAEIFHTEDITKGWDGRYKGELCQAGNYVFKVSYSTSLQSINPPQMKIGSVLLMY